jgi:hypothetical protein
MTGNLGRLIVCCENTSASESDSLDRVSDQLYLRFLAASDFFLRFTLGFS